MGLLTMLHRWLGVAFCLIFTMWFATGMVMHFVPFPALTEGERINGLGPIDASRILRAPGEAVQAAPIAGVERIRLLERGDGPVYIMAGTSGVAAVRADDLSNANVVSHHVALSIAVDHARRRGLDVRHAVFTELAQHDQWTVPNSLDRHRPLYRISLNDAWSTELYVSSATGEIMRDTTRTERWWNYAGSVAHWIYPTVLRSRPKVWHATVWAMSLIGLIAALAGALLGVLRLNMSHWGPVLPYRGWHAWHHALGLACMPFLLSWILSGWLSMDNGALFSTDKVVELAPPITAVAASGDSQWQGEIRITSPQALEIEWFTFAGKLYRRERTGLESQHLSRADLNDESIGRAFLLPEEVEAHFGKLGLACDKATVIPSNDDYAVIPIVPGSPIYRIVCSNVWFHIDGANAAILQRLDSSRRAYRWLYSALHTLDVPPFSHVHSCALC